MLNAYEIDLVAGGWGTTGATLDGMILAGGSDIEVRGFRYGAPGFGFSHGYGGPETGNSYPGDPADLGAGSAGSEGPGPDEIVVTAPHAGAGDGDTQAGPVLKIIGKALVDALVEKGVEKAVNAAGAPSHEDVINKRFSDHLTSQESTKVKVTITKDRPGESIISWYYGERFTDGSIFFDSDGNGRMDIQLFQRNGNVYFDIGDNKGFRTK
ncbi:hypothetical protein CAP40_14505 [Sphingomonas sp. IBVSS2]|uniref:hypothetical protein n=1 Tax=Sphingomonas sp. IBVSS2 TaxID=1985172 RepID=UPI000A2DA1B8|nr:hypothetical protein [Sphingomonas sp. IBVSS2]OSZ65025.1 hypothetical protein CAP40_14505 [Sphingomonas sp. IBVSS2]